MTLRELLHLLYQRFLHWVQSAGPALPVTGILGLALVVYGYLQHRGDNTRGQRQPGGGQPRPAPGASASSQRAQAVAAQQQNADATTSQPAAAAKPAAVPTTSATAVGRAVAAQLAGIRRVTLSLPGVVFAESMPTQLQESATVRAEVVEVLQEMSRAADVYLIAHVEDDLGQAVVTGALEAAGLLGTAPGQIRPHHVLCCATLEGKVPIVRQLEPDLHIDSHATSVDELKRFLPQLLLVREGLAAQTSSTANVGVAPSLRSWCSL